MREALGKYNGQYIEVTSKFAKIIKKNGFTNLLFVDTKKGDEILTDHFWMAAINVKNKAMIKELEVGKTYRLRGKVYIYKKISKVDGTRTVPDYNFKGIKIISEEV